MKTIADLADLATVGSATREDLSTPHGRALALFVAAMRLDRVEWQANGTTVVLLWCGAGEYGVAVDGVQRAKGTIGATLETVKQLAAGLGVPHFKPTPTARAYKQFGFWADVQDGYLLYYAMHSEGGWDKDPAAVEFACQHLLDRVNADFGTAFTMDGFQEDTECACAD